MNKYHSRNERVKKEYFVYLKEAEGRAESTIDGVRKAISRYEEHTRFKDFSTINKQQIIGFKDQFASTRNQRTGVMMSKSTMLSTMNILKGFFTWLSYQEGYRSKIYVPDLRYFSLTAKEIAIAKAPKDSKFPSIEQINKVISLMSGNTAIERRNRALIAFTILTGMRDSAIASVKLKHVNIEERKVLQDPHEVDTKFSKQIHTTFFPVGDDIERIVVDWIKELEEKQLYSPADPLFPKTALTHDSNNAFHIEGLEPAHWQTTTSIRKVFREAFSNAGLPYYNPHSFRHTLGHMAYEYCKTPEQTKAWSQNLGHENVSTTLYTYGKLDPYRQGQVMQEISPPSKEDKQNLKALLLQVANGL